MAFRHLRNIRGFFSDYYLGSIFGRGEGRGRRRQISDRNTDLAYRRFLRIHEQAESRALDASSCRERLIRPLFRDVLGFHLGQGSDRVHSLFASAEEEASGKPSLVVAYCGAWDEDLDTGRGNTIPRRRVENALVSGGLNHGFLVTGERFRLIRTPGDGPSGAYLEVDLAGLADEDDPESFAAFYRLFNISEFLPSANGKPPIREVETESRKHAERVSEDLKHAVFTAAETLVAGLLSDAIVRGAITDTAALSDAKLHLFRDAALTALYRILFILYAEARDLRLDEHKIYRDNYSVHGLIDELLHDPTRDWPENSSGLWARLKALFRIYDQGLIQITPWENIPPRGGDFFKAETPVGRVLDEARLPDRTVAHLLLDLTTTSPRRGVGRERVSFRELDIESLGAVYEGLLEYEPRVARETTLEVSVQGRAYTLSPSEVVRLCQEKKLKVKGDYAIVAGTAAESLHPDAPTEEDDAESEIEENELSEVEDEAEDEEGEEAVKKGAVARLERRLEPGTFYFVPGHARKGSGSFYTPLPLVQDLVCHALAPLAEGKSSHEIERLRVLDPACGSAHFLVEAMRFLGKELHHAYVQEFGKKGPPNFRSTTGQGWDDDWKASDEEARVANSEARAWCKRRIAERCLFGVDLNPTAVNLAHVALWIESLAGDRPLTYFEHHIRCGNSLLGTWLDRLDQPPLPSMARIKAPEQWDLFADTVRKGVAEAAQSRRLIDEADTEDLRREGIDPESIKEQEFKEHQRKKAEETLAAARLLFDLRSASAFLPEIWGEWQTLCGYISDRERLVAYAQSRPWWDAFQKIREWERFFHWELEFPEVFLDSERPGFEAVLGNPPWDKVLPAKHEFYARYDILIRAYKGNDLDRRIKELHNERTELAEEFKAYTSQTTTMARMLRKGGDFPLSEARSQAAHDDLSKYFVDRAGRLTAEGGAVAMVVPSLLYNGDGCVGIRRFLLEKVFIERFYGFENRRRVFPIDSRKKFVNLVFRKTKPQSDDFMAAFMRHDPGELSNPNPKPWMIRITEEEIRALSPETLAFLEYRGPRDQEIVHKMHRGCLTLGARGPRTWGAEFFNDLTHEQIYNAARDKDLWTNPSSGRLFSPTSVLGDETDDLGETIRQMGEKGFWPLFEGKHIDQFLIGIKPVRWWVSIEAAERKYGKRPRAEATLVFRETASNTNERTCIAAILPTCSTASNKLSGLLVKNVCIEAAATVLNSLVFDYVLRLRNAGTNVSFTYMRPMPVPPLEVVNRLPCVPTLPAWATRVTHITEVQDLWALLWSANRAVAEAYGLTPDDFEHILNSFPVFARKRPAVFAYVRERLEEWKTEAGRDTRPATVYVLPAQQETAVSVPDAGVFAQTRRASRERKPHRATEQFKQAVILAWVVNRLYNPPYAVSRFRAEKMIYLIERATSLGLFQDFLKHAAGPYDSSLRYKGPEDIAVRQQKWLELVGTSQFKPGPKIQRALKFVPRYIDLGSADRVIDNFRTYKDETLERWTTIDMAALDVIRQRKSVTVSSILSYIESLPEWKDKLVRTEFAPEHVERTLQGLRAMGFLKSEDRVSD